MADETENTEIEETSDRGSRPRTWSSEAAPPEVEEPAAEAEPVAEAEEDPEPEAEEPAPAEEEPAAEPEPMAAEAAEEPVAEAEPRQPPADERCSRRPRRHRPRSRPPSPARSRRRSGCRVPSDRRRRDRSADPAAERKPITRLPKPEHERGRRQERQGTVVSAAADKTIVVRVDIVKVHPRYKKVIKRSTRLHAHDEENEAKLGDVVRIVETRPLSRMKRWRLQEIVEAAK